MRISFLIPAYNERETIRDVLDAIEALALDRQIIVVDDGSTDGTTDAVEELRGARPDVVLVRQPNMGKGRAANGDPLHRRRHRCDPGRGHGVRPCRSAGAGGADRARGRRYGLRISALGRAQRAYLFWHLVGNRFLSLLTSLLYNTTLNDMETGYKAFRADVLRSLDLRQDDFSIEPEITAKVCLRNLRVYQLPISYYGRTYNEGKKVTWRDGAKAIWVLMRIRVAGR